MKQEISEQYPLFKDYDFAIHFSGSGGDGVLLIPKKERYVAKNYGFGYLALAPYLQEPFNEGESITIRDLITEMKEEGEHYLVPSEVDRDLGREQPFLHKIINRFRKHEIAKLDKKAGLENSIHPNDVLSVGENYDRVRVYRMQQYSGSGDELLDPSGSPFPSDF